MSEQPLFILTTDVVESKRSQVTRLRQRIHEAEIELNETLNWLKAVEVLTGQTYTKPEESREGATTDEVTFPSVIADLLARHREGATYNQIKDAVLASPLKERYERNSNSLYNTVARLIGRGRLFKVGDTFLSPESHAELSRSGKLEDLEGAPESKETMYDVVKEFLAGREDTSVARIRERIEEVALLRDQLKRNPQYLYSVLSRLTKRGELVRGDEGYRLADSNRETSSDDAEDASKFTGEGGSSPIENQRREGVFG